MCVGMKIMCRLNENNRKDLKSKTYNDVSKG